MKWITSKYTTNIYLATILQFGIILFVYTLLRLIFYYLNTSLFPDISGGYLMHILLAGIKFDISALCYLNSLFILIRFLPVDFPARKSWLRFTNIVFWVTNVFFIIGNIADAAYFPFINSRSQISLISEFGQDSNALGILVSYIKPYWYVVLIFTLLSSVFVYFTNRIQVREKLSRPFTYKRFFIRLGLMILIAAFMVLGMRGRIEDGFPLNASDAANDVRNNRDVNLVLNSTFTFIQSIGQTEVLPTRNYMPDSEAQRYYSPVHLPKDTIQPFRKKNVMVIVLEGIGNGFIGGFNDGINIKDFVSYTPFLDSLCKQSLIFENAYASARSSIKGINSSLGGFPAYDIYYMRSPYNRNEIDGLPRLLKPLGYESVFYCGCNRGSYSFENFSKAIGYKRFVGRSEYNNEADFDGQWGIFDHKMARYILNDIDTLSKPFVASWFTLTSHGPFKVPTEYQGKYEGCANDTKEQAVRYVDETLKNFFAAASKKSWFKNTLFVITADHSQVMSQYPDYNTVNMLFHVPLIFYSPDNSILPGKNEINASQLDITPSVLGHLNYSKPYVAFGKNLFEKNDSSFVVSWIDKNYMIFKGDYLLQFDGNKTTGLFNKKLDPFVKNNIISDTSKVQKELEILIKAYLQDYTRRVAYNKIAWQNEGKD
jgi:phosphoglycerol transferase MdoB-like AlkP superfamily enzyme